MVAKSSRWESLTTPESSPDLKDADICNPSLSSPPPLPVNSWPNSHYYQLGHANLSIRPQAHRARPSGVSQMNTIAWALSCVSSCPASAMGSRTAWMVRTRAPTAEVRTLHPPIPDGCNEFSAGHPRGLEACHPRLSLYLQWGQGLVLHPYTESPPDSSQNPWALWAWSLVNTLQVWAPTWALLSVPGQVATPLQTQFPTCKMKALH